LPISKGTSIDPIKPVVPRAERYVGEEEAFLYQAYAHIAAEKLVVGRYALGGHARGGFGRQYHGFYAYVEGQDNAADFSGKGGRGYG
jgi:hypothetical protein